MIDIDMASFRSFRPVIIIVVNSSLFRGNKGNLSHSDGAGLSIHYYGSMKPQTSLTIKIRGTRFYENGGIYRGGGMFFLYRACKPYTICNVDRRALIAQHASMRLYIQDCHFVLYLMKPHGMLPCLRVCTVLHFKKVPLCILKYSIQPLI